MEGAAAAGGSLEPAPHLHLPVFLLCFPFRPPPCFRFHFMPESGERCNTSAILTAKESSTQMGSSLQLCPCGSCRPGSPLLHAGRASCHPCRLLLLHRRSAGGSCCGLLRSYRRRRLLCT